MDTEAQLNAIDRTVAPGARDGADTYVQTVARTYPAPIDELWDALTTAERLPRWFAPVTGDLRLGGRYQIEGNAGGTVERCDAPNTFDVTWEFGGGVSWLSVRLSAVDAEHTRLELEHIAPADGISAEMWVQFGPGATGLGWDQSLLGLGLYLTAGRGMDPAEAEAWALDEEGRAFMRGSADRWAHAHITMGADPEVAQRAADTTFAFYTTAPAES